jgi:hypothetical protein
LLRRVTHTGAALVTAKCNPSAYRGIGYIGPEEPRWSGRAVRFAPLPFACLRRVSARPVQRSCHPRRSKAFPSLAGLVYRPRRRFSANRLNAWRSGEIRRPAAGRPMTNVDARRRWPKKDPTRLGAPGKERSLSLVGRAKQQDETSVCITALPPSPRSTPGARRRCGPPAFLM